MLPFGHHVLVPVVRSPIRVHQRALGVHRRDEVRDRRQGFVVHLDQRRGLGRDLLGERGHAGNDLGLEPHDVLGEEGSVLCQAAEPDVRQVCLRDHRDHARHRASRCGVDAKDPGVGMVGVAEASLGHAGGREVGGVAPGAGDLLLAVGPDEPRALCRGARRHLCPFPVAHIIARASWGDKPAPEPAVMVDLTGKAPAGYGS